MSKTGSKSSGKDQESECRPSSLYGFNVGNPRLRHDRERRIEDILGDHSIIDDLPGIRFSPHPSLSTNSIWFWRPGRCTRTLCRYAHTPGGWPRPEDTKPHRDQRRRCPVTPIRWESTSFLDSKSSSARMEFQDSLPHKPRAGFESEPSRRHSLTAPMCR